jgi:hypothetical protein
VAHEVEPFPDDSELPPQHFYRVAAQLSAGPVVRRHEDQAWTMLPGLEEQHAGLDANVRASYGAVRITVRFSDPVTTTGFPLSAGLAACSTEAKKLFISRCRIVLVVIRTP